MARATVAILFFFILSVATLSTAQAPVESPKAAEGAAPAKAPEAAPTKRAATGPASRKSGPAATPTSEAASSQANSVKDVSSLPAPPMAVVVISPVAEGPAADADDSGVAALGNGAAVTIVAVAAVTVIFA